MVRGRVRADERAPGGFEMDVVGRRSRQRGARLSNHAEGTRHGIFDGSSPSLAALAPPARDSQSAPHGRQSRARFSGRRMALRSATRRFSHPPPARERRRFLKSITSTTQKAYLTQSGQLYNEATAAAFGKAYCFGPTFRAEKSKTRRHLTEFWMVEPEMAYATLDDVMDLCERFLSYIAARVLEDRAEELKTLERDTAKLEAIVPPFPRLHYDEAVKMLAGRTRARRGRDAF